MLNGSEVGDSARSHESHVQIEIDPITGLDRVYVGERPDTAIEIYRASAPVARMVIAMPRIAGDGLLYLEMTPHGDGSEGNRNPSLRIRAGANRRDLSLQDLRRFISALKEIEEEISEY